jgi:hypothetical protein
MGREGPLRDGFDLGGELRYDTSVMEQDRAGYGVPSVIFVCAAVDVTIETA